MGSARHISWSFSQEQLHRHCPRAFFWDYFPWGEPEERVARYLSKVTSLDQLSGLILHNSIVLGLRQYQHIRVIPADLAERAVAKLHRQISMSRAFADSIKLGKRPPTAECVLDGHLYGGHTDTDLRVAEAMIRDGLTNLTSSELWKVIRSVRRRDWLEVETNTCASRHVLGGTKLGLPQGFRIYTAFDFGVKVNGGLHLIDWKAGRFSEPAEALAIRQLTGYSLWAFDQGSDPSAVTIQPAFLGETPPAWAPVPVRSEVLTQVKEGIARHHEMLTERLAVERLTNRRSQYIAQRGAFSKTSCASRCVACKYRALCHPKGLN
ncbi:MAG: PD-(D/E)XK nuclease family protein [Fimbriimonadaceae bacterium]|nr:PD-(D/E)XK nuclease family protein [Fimbriimonadaceae bacterium]